MTGKQRRALQLLAAAVIVAFCIWVIAWLPSRDNTKVSASRIVEAGYTTLPSSFAGSSEELRRTSVVPTLESPIPKGNSALWCASLALAWKQMELDVLNGPFMVEGAEEISQRLTGITLPDIRPDDKFVAAGAIKDGIVERIRRDLQARFPEAPLLSDLPQSEQAFLAYAYLQVAVRFTHIFPTSEAPMRFLGSGAKDAKEVCAFGIPETAAGEGIDTYRKQVHVLFHNEDEFAVDPDRNSRPYQIVLARIKRPETLQKALDELANRTKNGKGAEEGLDQEATLLLPFMNWTVQHMFKELSNKRIRAAEIPDAKTLEVAQTLRFKLDPSGAAVASGAHIGAWANGAPHLKLSFDRPFLVVLKPRTEEEPICALWIDNAELLQNWPPRKEVK